MTSPSIFAHQATRHKDFLAAQARRERGHEMRSRAEERFSALEAKVKQKEPEVHKCLEDVRARLADELDMRSTSQESIVQDMMRFMQHFETSISMSGQRQEKTKDRATGGAPGIRDDTHQVRGKFRGREPRDDAGV
eukprot:Skav222075  [mRNA]  locus=scaffold4586:61991:71704:- [translate_table: standard]